jgi:hypothetical protein
MIELNCDKCGQHYEIDDEHAGAEAECAECGATFKIPAIPAEEKPVEPEAAEEEPAEPEEVKAPSLSMPNSFKERMRQREAGSAPEPASGASSGEAGSCPKCGAELQSKNAVICTECGTNVKLGVNVKTLNTAKTAGKFGIAIGVGAAAALISGGIWAWIAISLQVEIGWIACLIGLITGLAVCLVTPERSTRMGAVAVALACVGLLAGKLLTAEYQIRNVFKSFENMSKEFAKADKEMGGKFQELAQMGILGEEMREKGEIKDNNEELDKLAPKAGEKPSKEYQAALKKSFAISQANQEKIKKKFKTLSNAQKAALQKKVERLLLAKPLYDEMVANGEITKPDESWEEKLAPKEGEKPSKEYLEALKKYQAQETENLKKVKEKLFSMSDADAKRLQESLGSTISGSISYWEKLKMVSSFWDILWFLLAISTAWGLGTGTSDLFHRD